MLIRCFFAFGISERFGATLPDFFILRNLKLNLRIFLYHYLAPPWGGAALFLCGLFRFALLGGTLGLTRSSPMSREARSTSPSTKTPLSHLARLLTEPVGTIYHLQVWFWETDIQTSPVHLNILDTCPFNPSFWLDQHSRSYPFAFSYEDGASVHCT